jgi:hypothetical protein
MPAKIATTCSSVGHGAVLRLVQGRDHPLARASVRRVASSSSEPNCANASSSRYWARSSFRRRRPGAIAFTCAFPPTARDRDADVDRRADAGEEQIGLEEDLPSVIEITFVGM